jgi:hypothetical protein
MSESGFVEIEVEAKSRRCSLKVNGIDETSLPVYSSSESREFQISLEFFDFLPDRI